MYYNQNPTQILTLKFSKNDGVRNHKNTNDPPNWPPRSILMAPLCSPPLN